MPSDEERCRLIAESEEAVRAQSRAGWLIAGEFYPSLPDYAHDLNATMRAARRLAPMHTMSCALMRGSDWYFWIHKRTRGEGKITVSHGHADDAATAAYIALSDYLATRREK